MNTQKKPFCYAVASSLALHGCLLIGLIVDLEWFADQPAVGYQSALPSYLYEPSPTTVKVHKALPLKPPKPLKAIVSREDSAALDPLESVEAASKAESVAPSSTTQTSKPAGIEPPDALLSLLHDAIQTVQRYPASALSMQREGAVTVGFVLAPDGTISELTLVKTSGTASLDTAALAAVLQAAPFSGVAPYVSVARAFQLVVRFELPTEIS